MRILIATPIPMTAVGGPASVARSLKTEFEKGGDSVRVVTFNTFEKILPPPFRQIVLFFRAFFLCIGSDALILLDPASTGPSFALAAWLTHTPSVLRIGGDSLWEAYVERTKEAILLSEFYTTKRTFSRREQLIHSAARMTMCLVNTIVFTNSWMREIWMKPYALHTKTILTIENPLPAQERVAQATGMLFLASGRPMRIKNIDVLTKDVWPRIQAEHPEAILDTEPKKYDAYLEALEQAYAVILPSLSDVSPNSILEAIRYGKPFMCTRDTGLYEQYKERGIFVDTRNADEIRKAINTLLTKEGYANALEHARKPYTAIDPASIAARFRALVAR